MRVDLPTLGRPTNERNPLRVDTRVLDRHDYRDQPLATAFNAFGGD
jgi:hypothetical protein